ncbi:MAG: FGGY-family carbohydrate kinase [Treponema sp.]|jgi:sugar (pentulose or hexulose) kinase|nr:FGGY-family carbohydrate kinase [Treponema sp.]
MLPCVLTADIGSSSLKSALIDFDGYSLAKGGKNEAHAAYDEAKGGTVRAADWENAFFLTVRELFQKNKNIEIKAVCISGNGPTLVPVSFHGETLSPIHWYDAKNTSRSKGQPSFFLPHVLSFMETRPQDYEKTKCFLSPHEWLIWRLGAEPATSLPSPAYKPYYWDEEQCGALGIDLGKFPPQISMGAIAGRLNIQATERLGLGLGIPLVSGAPDFISALIGTGVLKPGMVCDRAGSSEGINVCVEKKLQNFVLQEALAPVNAEGLRALPHAVEGLWNLSAVIPQSGRLFEQYRKQNGNGRDYADILKDLIPEFPSGPSYRTYNEVYNCEGWAETQGRLILEKIGFSVRAALDALLRGGFPVKEMIVSGGQAKNPLWNQLKADITGSALLIPQIVDGELAGNAVLAALALGEVSSLEEGAARMIRIIESYFPREESVVFWNERFRIHKEKADGHQNGGQT